jgi:hypothetical protein
VRRQQDNPDYNRALFDEIHRLAHERFGPAHEALVPFHLRIRSRLLRAGDFAGLEALAAFEAQLRAHADAYVRENGDGVVEVRVDATLRGETDPLAFRRDGERVLWVPPASLRERLLDDALEATADLDGSTLQLLVRAAEGPEFVASTKAEVRLAQEGVPVLIGDAALDPSRAAAGAALAPGDYGLQANPIVAGFTKTVAARRRSGRRPVQLTVDASGVLTVAKPKAAAPAPTATAVKLKRRVKRLLGR